MRKRAKAPVSADSVSAGDEPCTRPSPATLNQPRDSFWVAVCASIIAALVFALYYLTAYRTIAGGDSPELIVAAHQLGVAHPPGYPLFTILGFVFSRLVPVGGVAFKINLLSAVCGALSAANAFLVAQRWCVLLFGPYAAPISLPCASVSASLFALTQLQWSYHTHAEVFALNNFFVGLVLYVAVLAFEKSSSEANRWYFVGAFVIGLGLTNQHTLVFLALPVAVWSLSVDPSLLKPHNFVRLCGAGLAGLSPYLYLVVAASNPKLGSWGNTATLSGLVTHLLRREYGTFQLYSGSEGRPDVTKSVALYLQHFAAESFFVGLALATIGIGTVVGMRAGRSVGVLVVASFLFYIIGFHSLSNLPIDKPLYMAVHVRFWMQPNFILCVLAGVGSAAIASRLPLGRWKSPVAWAAAALLAVTLVARNYEGMDQSANVTIRDYGLALMASAPNGSLVLVTGDAHHNTLRYLQTVEGYRPDLSIVDQALMTWKWFKITQGPSLPDVIFPGTNFDPFQRHPRDGSFRMGAFLKNNLPFTNRKIVICGGWYDTAANDRGVEGYRTRPNGLCDIVSPSDVPPPYTHDFISHNEKILAAATTPSFPLPRSAQSKYPPGSWEHSVSEDYWAGEHRVWSSVLTLKNEIEEEAERQRIAVLVMKKMENLFNVQYGPINPEWYRNLGIAAAHSGGSLGGPTMLKAFKEYVQNQKDPRKKADVETVRGAISQIEERVKMFGEFPTIQYK